MASKNSSSLSYDLDSSMREGFTSISAGFADELSQDEIPKDDMILKTPFYDVVEEVLLVLLYFSLSFNLLNSSAFSLAILCAHSFNYS
jgi:hypothetical protein